MKKNKIIKNKIKLSWVFSVQVFGCSDKIKAGKETENDSIGKETMLMWRKNGRMYAKTIKMNQKIIPLINVKKGERKTPRELDEKIVYN